jgi:hypothetical protein
MATDIDSLAPGLDGHAIRLGIKKRKIFFRCIHQPIVDSVAKALLNITPRLPTFLCRLSLTLFALPVSSTLLRSLGHETMSVISNPVDTFAASSSILLVMTLG